MDSTHDWRVLGILGGMGPLAGATFAARLVALTPAERDQDHIPVLLCNDPRIPDRTDALMANGEDPLNRMVQGIRWLESAGAEVIAVPCNTAHFWYDALTASARIPLLHIVDAVRADLTRRGVQRSRVAVMGTPATLRLGLYQEPLSRDGHSVLPLEHVELNLCVRAIEAVKAGREEDAFEPAARCIDRLVERGAEAIVLGCTELPLAIPPRHRIRFGVELTDSIDALAIAAIEAARV